MLKKIFILFAALLILCPQTFALDNKFNIAARATSLKSQKYLNNINNLKIQLVKDPQNVSIKSSLINAYLKSARYHKYTFQRQKYANDLRSALFYIKVYDPKRLTSSEYDQTLLSLAAYERRAHLDLSSQGKLDLANKLYNEGNYEPAGWEYYSVYLREYSNSECAQYMGEVYQKLSYNQKAFECYVSAIKEDPSNLNAKVKLALFYNSIGEHTEAQNILNQVLFNLNDNKDLLCLLEKAFADEIKRDASDSDNYMNLGMVYQKQKRYDLAYQQYQKAISLNADDIFVKYVLGTLYYEQGSYQNAIDVFSDILTSMPSDSQIRAFRADSLAKIGKVIEAQKDYDYILRIYPNSKRPKIALYQLIKDKESPETILRRLYPRLGSRKLSAQNFYFFASTLKEYGLSQDANRFYQLALSYDPKITNNYLNLSSDIKNDKDLMSAYYMARRAADLNPNNQEIKNVFNSIKLKYNEKMLSQADSLVGEGQYQGAISLYKRVEPETFKTTFSIATCYQLLKDDKNAIEFYKKAAKLDPGYADTFYHLAIIYYNRNDFSSSKEYLRKTLQVNPKHENAQKLVSHVEVMESGNLIDTAYDYYAKGNFVKALEVLNKVIKEDPKNSEAFFYRAMVYDMMKKYPNALSDYNMAYKLNSKLEDVYYFIARAYDKMGNKASAIDSYDKFLTNEPQDADYITKAQKRIIELGAIK